MVFIYNQLLVPAFQSLIYFFFYYLENNWNNHIGSGTILKIMFYYLFFQRNLMHNRVLTVSFLVLFCIISKMPSVR